MQQIGWGILGTGTIANQFAQGLAYAPHASLRGVASRDPGKAVDFARRFAAARAHGSVEELCADPSIDVIYVATPNESHRAHSLVAIEAGKAVLCEKPFGLTVLEAREVLAAAERRDVFCMEGMWMRCAPALRQVLEIAASGALGDCLTLCAQLGFANRPEGNGRLFRQPGGGALLDLGVYPIALSQALFGAPSSVEACARFGPTGVDECVSMLLGFPGGAQATLTASIRSELGNAAQLYGSRARAVLGAPLYFPTALTVTAGSIVTGEGGSAAPGIADCLKQSPALRPLMDFARHRRGLLRSRTSRLYPRGTGLTCEAEEVMRCLRSGLRQSPLVTHRDTLESAAIVDEVRRVWKTVAVAPAA